MRYFKCENVFSDERFILQKKYAELTKKEKKIRIKQKVLKTIGSIIFFTLSTFVFIGCNLLIGQIPEPKDWFLGILYYIGVIVLFLVSIIASVFIGGLVALPIINKAFSNENDEKKEILSKACEQLREFYNLQEPCVVTKCYESTDKRFTNHDVCVFVADDELRITTNLLHGFFHQRNDLGCYCFNREEVCVSKIEGEKFLIAELKAGNQIFLLGYRAKRFVEKNFIYNLEIYD